MNLSQIRDLNESDPPDLLSWKRGYPRLSERDKCRYDVYPTKAELEIDQFNTGNHPFPDGTRETSDPILKGWLILAPQTRWYSDGARMWPELSAGWVTCKSAAA